MNATYVPYGAQREVWAATRWRRTTTPRCSTSRRRRSAARPRPAGLYDNWPLGPGRRLRDPKFELEDGQEGGPARSAAQAVARRAAGARRRQEGQKRDEIKTKVDALGKQRDAFLLEERKKLGAAGDQRFEKAVLESVRAQAEARGLPARSRRRRKTSSRRSLPLIKDAARDYQRFVRHRASRSVAPDRLPPTCRRTVRGRGAAPRRNTAASSTCSTRGSRRASTCGPASRRGRPDAGQGSLAVRRGRADGRHRSERALPGRLTARRRPRCATPAMPRACSSCTSSPPTRPDTDQGWVYGTVDREGA
jgi:hypothetical protein